VLHPKDLEAVERRREKLLSGVLPRFPIRESELDRFKFGRKWYHEISKLQGRAAFCLDVGCGAKPFPMANISCDLYLAPVRDRRMQELKTEGKPFVVCDGRFLPFTEKAFQFVTCFYLLEHIDEPAALFRELRRVSRHGYLQCPSWIDEILYGEKVHKWIILKRDGRLYVRPTRKWRSLSLVLGFVFHRLYMLSAWRLSHTILDEALHLFTVQYAF
jgi:SAM-dependent methyltransferase